MFSGAQNNSFYQKTKKEATYDDTFFCFCSFFWFHTARKLMSSETDIYAVSQLNVSIYSTNSNEQPISIMSTEFLVSFTGT